MTPSNLYFSSRGWGGTQDHLHCSFQFSAGAVQSSPYFPGFPLAHISRPLVCMFSPLPAQYLLVTTILSGQTSYFSEKIMCRQSFQALMIPHLLSYYLAGIQCFSSTFHISSFDLLHPLVPDSPPLFSSSRPVVLKLTKAVTLNTVQYVFRTPNHKILFIATL